MVGCIGCSDARSLVSRRSVKRPSPGWGDFSRAVGKQDGTPVNGSSLRVQLPALSRDIVFGARLDPAFAGRGFLAFPERRVGLQPIDQKLTGGERSFAVRRGRRDEHNAVAGFEAAIAVDDQHGIQRPAPVRLRLDLAELLLGHAWVVLKSKGGGVVTPSPIANQPDEAGDPTYPMVSGGKAFELGADVKILALHPDHRSNRP